MNRSYFLLIFFLNFFIISGLSGTCPDYSEHLRFYMIQQDTFPENQILYNGRIWRNLYYRLNGDQLIFTNMFMPGSLTINGKTFTNIDIKHDIFSDEILIPIDSGRILQLNKELVDSFSVVFQNKKYRFTKMQEDSLKRLKSYVNVIYKGETALYVKYNKKIDRSAIEGKSDSFYQTSRIYFVKDNKAYTLTDKSDLFEVLKKDKAQIRDFMKKNKLRVSKKDPESFVPVIRYYDSISR